MFYSYLFYSCKYYPNIFKHKNPSDGNCKRIISIYINNLLVKYAQKDFGKQILFIFNASEKNEAIKSSSKPADPQPILVTRNSFS